ncbi:MAG: hypothetical protein C4532_06985 [Candidatus Abyssobacteria bacterium SURF_17]|uniref:DNA recombination and repair protein Rad51-like C-terminal domain-containing protein n=1 Tax=Candidatus Abyssobacteria bacterium SURF_17 TaxID=2093361 RepID=A0A419F1A4_9BACT|nr:MAG: hypothetical protein C4532_06985 [Candidatus Abyssubacteria bacterium SURF_17]
MEKDLIFPGDGALESICVDLGTCEPRHDGATIVLAYGTPASSVTYLALCMAFAGVARERPVVFLDGGNSFDPYLISKLARRAGFIPEELLSRLRISRAFTCHQMEALVVERLENAFKRFDTDVAIVSGLLDTFYDEDVPFGEAYDLLKKVVAEFVRLADARTTERGAHILIACPDTHLPREFRQRRFVDLLKKISHKVLRSEGSDAGARFALEKPHKKSYSRLQIPELSYQGRW